MSYKLCPMCFQPILGKVTFCGTCYHGEANETIKEALYSGKRPKWLQYMEASAAVEGRRLEKERQAQSIWND